MSLNTCRSLRSTACANALFSDRTETIRVANSVFIKPPGLSPTRQARRGNTVHYCDCCAIETVIDQRRRRDLWRCDVAFTRADRERGIAELDANRVPAPVLVARTRITEV